MKNILVAVVTILSLVVPFSGLDLVRFDGKSKSLAPADSLYFNLAGGNFTQDWTNAGLITTNDIWTGVPSVEGYLGQGLTTATAVDPQTVLGTSVVADDLDVIAQAATTTISGGVGEFDGLPNATVGMQGSGTADAPHILIYLNSTGRQSLQVSYNLRDIDGTVDNAVQPVALQYRVGTTGDFTNVSAGFVADASSGPSLATLVTPVNVTLPAAVDNQAQIQVRIITTNAASNDEWIGVDDIVVSSSPVEGGSPGTIQFTAATQSVAESGAFATITATRTGGTDGSVGVSYATSNGTATAGPPCNASGSDYNAATGSLVWGPGDAADKFFTFPICDDADFEGDETVNVTMTSPTGGATLGTTTSVVVTITDNDPQPAVIQFSSSTYVDDESQTAILTVTRSGDTSGTSTVDVASSAVTATPNSICGFGGDYIPLETTLAFSPGITTREYAVPLCADAFTEAAESLTATLSNPGGTAAVLGSISEATLSINDTASKFRNESNIAIEDGTQTAASSIEIDGEAGPVGSIRVTLYDVQHINAGDIDVLLVGPDGQNILLMSDAGGSVGLTTSQTLTFVDSAGQVLPQNGVFTPGQYEPTSWTPGQPTFNPPAPVGPYNEPGSDVGGGPNLTSVFGGTDPNGTWTLYIRDDNGAAVTAGGINGNVAGGWGLEIFTQPGAAASMSGSVRTLTGRPVRGAFISISGGTLAQPKYVTTRTFGNYNVAGLEAGQVYTIQIVNRKYTFSPTFATFTLNSNLSGADFLATPN